jgi:hypothetical protein
MPNVFHHPEAMVAQRLSILAQIKDMALKSAGMARHVSGKANSHRCGWEPQFPSPNNPMPQRSPKLCALAERYQNDCYPPTKF